MFLEVFGWYQIISCNGFCKWTIKSIQVHFFPGMCAYHTWKWLALGAFFWRPRVPASPAISRACNHESKKYFYSTCMHDGPWVIHLEPTFHRFMHACTHLKKQYWNRHIDYRLMIFAAAGIDSAVNMINQTCPILPEYVPISKHRSART